MKKLKFSLFVFIFLFLGCKQYKEKQEISRVVKEWQGKEIVFPENAVFTRYGKDTVDYHIPTSKFKILMYVDSFGCTSCKLHLYEWQQLISEIDSLTNKNTPILFFFNTKDKQELSYILKRDNFDLPICIDDNDLLNRQNKFLSNQNYQCFLLDDKNRVILIGNPVHNIQIKQMYLAAITKRKQVDMHEMHNTQVQVDQTTFDFGQLKKGVPTIITVQIRNTGAHPYLIYDTKASCGCTDVKYDKKPTAPGGLTEVKITYRAEEAGYFDKTVSIYGNIADTPVVIHLKGNVK